MVIVRRVNLNNKSRKGTYIYVKDKGRRGSYYKEQKGISLNSYISLYNLGGVRYKKQGAKNIRKTIKRARRKAPNIEKSLKKGLASNLINNAERLTPYGIKTAYMNLLRNKGKAGDKKGIVRDPELVEILSRSDIVEKWKHRVMFTVEISGSGGNMITINAPALTTLQELKRDLLDKLRLGSDFSSSYGIIKKIGEKGYKMSYGIFKGRISNIRVKMTFRKGSK